MLRCAFDLLLERGYGRQWGNGDQRNLYEKLVVYASMVAYGYVHVCRVPWECCAVEASFALTKKERLARWLLEDFRSFYVFTLVYTIATLSGSKGWILYYQEGPTEGDGKFERFYRFDDIIIITLLLVIDPIKESTNHAWIFISERMRL